MNSHTKHTIRRALDVLESAAPELAGVLLGPAAPGIAAALLDVADAVVNEDTETVPHPVVATDKRRAAFRARAGALGVVQQHHAQTLANARAIHAETPAPPPGAPPAPVSREAYHTE